MARLAAPRDLGWNCRCQPGFRAVVPFLKEPDAPPPSPNWPAGRPPISLMCIIACSRVMGDAPVEGGSAMESTQQDMAYWRMRAAAEQEAAMAADDPRVRQVHQIMALRYRELLGLVSVEESQEA